MIGRCGRVGSLWFICQMGCERHRGSVGVERRRKGFNGSLSRRRTVSTVFGMLKSDGYLPSSQICASVISSHPNTHMSKWQATYDRSFHTSPND